MRDIVIIGCGGFGREVQWLIERINEYHKEEKVWNILGYVDDSIEVGTMINGLKVLGNTEYLAHYKEKISVACAIGASNTRRKVIEKIIGNSNLEFPNLIDPSVQMSDLIELGKGNIICAANVLTVNIKILDFCIINLDCTVGHDVLFDSFVTVYPSVNISGCVNVGNCVELGTGTNIIQGKNINNGAVIGAGSVVIKDIPAQCTAVGSPCKPIKYHISENISGGV